MSRTEAQIAASRANGLKSRGPISAEGKAISRRNALKHGMAGDGVVVPEGDAAEVRRRSAAMLREIRPTCEMGHYLVKRIARLTVRVERCSSQELAAIEHRAAHAEADFDEARIAEVDHTLAYLIKEPATYARKLRSMPEGVDRLIACLLELREELDSGRWDWTYGDRLANLTGQRWAEVPVIRVHALSEAIIGNFKFLSDVDGEGLSDPERAGWARDEMGRLIDQEIESLLEHRKTLDLEAIDADRAGAADRACFDPSREAILARRYEAAAERAVYKALKELRRVEAEASMPVEAIDEEVLGSFGLEDREDFEEAEPGLRWPSTARPTDPRPMIRPIPEGSWRGGTPSNPPR
ncbi:hypothetical protein P12x_002590 [Tundrisphaera lichenicola]|uniref:hypothetical protein n=1 Tax=Tundrisphaera lichenicola TaxID=2029860 RepID=UPI003EBAD403